MNLNRFRQAFGGIVISLLLSLLVLGGFNTALREIKSNTPTSTAQNLVSPSPQLNPSFTLRPSEPTHIPTLPPPTPTNCPPPQNWVAYVVQTEDTLKTLASQSGITPNDIISANCLYSSQLVPGSILYLPPQLTLPPPTPIPCGPPPGWIRYIVQPGDTLYRLSLNFGVSISQLQMANCLGNSIYIQAGQSLFVPNVPTRTPSPTITPTGTVTLPPSPSATLPPTETATLTVLPPTSTGIPDPTFTATQANTSTPIAPLPTETVTSTPTNTLTPTPPTTETVTSTATASGTASPPAVTLTETATVDPATITPTPTP